MDHYHSDDSARQRRASQSSRRPLRVLAAGTPPRRRARGFSVIELAVALSVFLLISTLLSLAVARGLSVSAAVRTDRTVEQSLSGQLTKLAAYPYATLLEGTFTVPDPCAGTAEGIAGVSCVDTPAGQMSIAYTYQRTDGRQPGTAACASDADPAQTNADHGFIGLCARIVTVADVPAETLALGAFSSETSTRVNAPTPGYQPGRGLVRAELAGDPAVVAAAAGKTLFLVRAANPRTVVASQRITGPVVWISTGDGSAGDPGCTPSEPCVLALSATNHPSVSDGLAITSTLTSGVPADGTVTGASVVAVPGEVTDATVTVYQPGTARLDLVARSGDRERTNPVPGSVCLWATFTDGPVTRTVPLCNTGDADRILLEDYQPTWASDPASPVRYPFPTDTPIALTLDHPDGSCPQAPGMLGSVPDAPAAATGPAGWAPRAVCTSHTWGTPGSGLGDPVILTSGDRQQREVVWAAGQADDSASPAAGYVGEPVLWTKPRDAEACSVDGTCVPVPAADYEPRFCPGSTCFSGGNTAPVVTAPTHLTFYAPQPGVFYTKTLTVNDIDGDAWSAATPGGLTGTAGWVLEYSTGSADGPWAPWPDAVGPLLPEATGPRPLWVRYQRPTDPTPVPATPAESTAVLSLTDSRGKSTDQPLRFVAGAGEYLELAVADVTLKQQSSDTTTVRALDADGNPVAGVPLTVTGAPTGMGVTAATTGATGRGVVTVTAGTVPTGRYTLTVTGYGNPATFDVVVTGKTSTVSVTTTGGRQGDGGTATATVTDATGDPVADATVTFAVDGTSDAYRQRIYPKPAGCATAADGTCTVTLVTEDQALPGQYPVSATSGNGTEGSALYRVDATPAAAVAVVGDTLARGDSDMPVTLSIRDAAGRPLAGIPVAVTSGTGITLTAAEATTGSTGRVALAADVTTDAAVGIHDLTLTAAGQPVAWQLRVVRSRYTLTHDPVAVTQEGRTPVVVAVTDRGGNPVPGEPVTLTAISRGLSATVSSATGPGGRFTLTVTSKPGQPTGSYRVVLTIADLDYDIPVTVTHR